MPSRSEVDTELRAELLAAHEELLRRDEAFRAWDEEAVDTLLRHGRLAVHGHDDRDRGHLEFNSAAW